MNELLVLGALADWVALLVLGTVTLLRLDTNRLIFSIANVAAKMRYAARNASAAFEALTSAMRLTGEIFERAMPYLSRAADRS